MFNNSEFSLDFQQYEKSPSVPPSKNANALDTFEEPLSAWKAKSDFTQSECPRAPVATSSFDQYTLHPSMVDPIPMDPTSYEIEDASSSMNLFTTFDRLKGSPESRPLKPLTPSRPTHPRSVSESGMFLGGRKRSVNEVDLSFEEPNAKKGLMDWSTVNIESMFFLLSCIIP